MNRHLREMGDMALRCLLLAVLLIGLWIACRTVWGY